MIHLPNRTTFRRSAGIDDYGTPSDASDDQRITNTFFPTGWERERKIFKGSSTDPSNLRQTTIWDWFDSGDLRTLRTLKGASQEEVESHTIGYFQDGDYVNGHRTEDTFTLKKAGNPACVTAACTATYTYDAQDRLTGSNDGHGGLSSYVLDPAGNVLTETEDGTTRTFTYSGSKLATATKSGATSEYHYDPFGNLDCITTVAGNAGSCRSATSKTAPSTVLADYVFDGLDRMTAYRTYAGGTIASRTEYSHDALARPTKQIEDAHSSSNKRTTLFTYLGLSDLVTSEDQSGYKPHDRTYAYDAWGRRLSMTDREGTEPTKRYTYGYDVHGSVSMLLGDDGVVEATYAYTPYGRPDEDLTKGDPEDDAQINPYRWQAKRLDEATGTYDMGFRRFGPDVGRFLSPDYYLGALDDLGLGLDPLTGNRYAFAGGNPVGYLDLDGHYHARDGSGAAAPEPATSKPANPSFGGIYSEPRTDYGSARSSALVLRTEQWGADYGVIRGCGYIPESSPGAGLAGDDRGPDAFAHPSRCRFSFAFNPAEGTLRFEVSPTCTSPRNDEPCTSAFPINDTVERASDIEARCILGFQCTNEVKVRSDARTVIVAYDLINSKKNPASFSTWGVIQIEKGARGRVTVPLPLRVYYPALEIYQDQPGLPPRQLLRQGHKGAWSTYWGTLAPFEPE